MKHLLEPMKAGGLSLKNRLVMPPMATNKAEADGAVSPGILDYYGDKTQSGLLGLVITEHHFVSPGGQAHPNQLSAADDAKLDGLKALADVIHRGGSPAVIQINHAGGMASSKLTGREPLAPSAVHIPRKRDGALPRELAKAEIASIVGDFAAAARRARDAGFDGVEIHAAHGFLLQQFYTPLINKRKDEYGGSVENRIRVILEIVAAIQSDIGKDFPVLVRLGAFDYMDGGVSLDDVTVAARAFEEAGVCVLDISGGQNGFEIPGGDGQPGYFAPLTLAAKKDSRIPVILTGGINHLEEAEQLLKEGKGDLIGVGRALMKDSKWVEKEFAGFGES
ncbi:MAG: NADH:flavin oxidoreductase [Peptococcaceae bacterium]|jgi:2,4-dienoyl-CoA reductase-like NADH-dependent reductase (Old Yellow Enzyme family)|nr:NADH:flavin oxidoreductase [Peptococcaceae bacterium]